jgi:hypothetical protein
MKRFVFVLLFLSATQVWAVDHHKTTADPFFARERVLKVLGASSGLSLTGHNGCSGFSEKGKGETTIGDFIAWNLATFDETKRGTISVSCNEKKDSNLCEVLFRSSAVKDESPWSCGLRFLIGAGARIEASSLVCIGTC